MMTNRNNLCIVCLLMLLCLSSTALAESFTVEGLRYNTLSATTVEVVKPESGKYSGDITIPAVVTHNETTYRITAIGDNAFQGANQVTSVTLPLTSVKSIGEYAFNDCTGLTEFTLPESITSIGKNAFYYCDNLKHLYVHSKDPASYNVGASAFSKINNGGNVCTLHVPTGCTAAYAADATFSVFTQVEEFDAPILIRYNLYVAGEQVNSLNASDILGNGAASYDAEKNILTLRDDIAAPDASTSCIMNEIENLTIQVAAPVTLSATDRAILSTAITTITGSSKLTVSISSDNYSLAAAIYNSSSEMYITNANISANVAIDSPIGDLFIENSTVSVDGLIGGGKQLHITNSTVTASSPSIFYSVIYGWQSELDLKDCYMRTPQGGKYVISSKRLEDAEGKLPQTVEILPGEGPSLYNLYISGERVTSENASDILGNGAASYDAEKNILTLRDDIAAPDASTSCIMNEIENLTIQVAAPVTLSATDRAILSTAITTITGSSKLTVSISSDNYSLAAAIYNSSSEMYITNANISANVAINSPIGDLFIENSTVSVDGLIGGGKQLHITNSTVTASSPSKFYYVIYGWQSELDLKDCYMRTPQGGKYVISSKRLEDAEGKLPQTVEILPGEGPSLYNLYISGERVTSENASDILGNGAASYDAEKNILTLRDDIAAPDASTSCIMNEIENLTIQVAAPVTLSATDRAILSTAITTITGSSKLTVSISSDNYSLAAAIYNSSSEMYITNANISANVAIDSPIGDLFIENSTVSVDGLIGGGEQLHITNSTVTASSPSIFYSVIYGWQSELDLKDCYIRTPQGGKYVISSKRLEDAEGKLPQTVEIVPTQAPLSGDVDGNGKVNAADIVAIVNFIMGNPPVVFYQTAADINEDGKINIADIVMLSNIIMGK